jgi:hypothetical protein
MTISPAVLRAMQAAGASTDIIIAAIEADAAQEAERLESKRANNAERQRRFKAKKRAEKVTAGNAGNALPGVTSSPEVSPNDIYSNPHPNPTTGAEAPCPLADRVVEAWNEGPGKRGATNAKPLNADRRKSLSLRLREHTEAEVFEAIRNVGQSDFHCGKNDRGWTANIGWLLKSPENFQKALELKPRKPLAPPASGAPTDLIQHILRRQAA